MELSIVKSGGEKSADDVVSIYNQRSETYDSNYKKTEHFIEEEIIKDAFEKRVCHSVFKDSKQGVLSIGCGTGNDITALQLEPDGFLGLDISYKMLKVARRNYPNYKFDHCDCSKPLGEGWGEFKKVCALFGVPNYVGLTSLMQTYKDVSASGMVAVMYADDYVPPYLSHIKTPFRKYTVERIKEELDPLVPMDNEFNITGLTFKVPDTGSPSMAYQMQAQLTELNNTKGCKYFILTVSKI